MEDSSISSRVGERSTGKRQYENTVSYTEVKRRAFSVPSPKKAVMHKPVPPKSISVKQMLKLGNLVESPEVVNLYQFDLNRMTWSIIPKPIEFNISKDLLGEGAFQGHIRLTQTNNHWWTYIYEFQIWDLLDMRAGRRLHYFLFVVQSAFSVVNPLSSNPTWTNSLGLMREYFCALPVTSALSLCTTISSLFLLGSFGLPCFPVLFSFIVLLNFFHLSALSTIFVYLRRQVILFYGNDRPWRFLFQFYFYLFLF